MSLIIDFLFGKKRIVKVPNIGDFESRIRKDNPSINYSWQFYGILDNQEKETSIIIHGNSKGPSISQKNALYELIDNIEDLIKQIEPMVPKSPMFSDWKNTFYIAAINTCEEKENSLEISFEPKDEDKTNNFGFIWRNNVISEIEAHTFICRNIM